MNILIVEDEKLLRENLKTILNMTYDMNVIVAENGEEGLIMSQQFKFDLIISDYNMPLFNGAEMVNKIRGNCQMNSVTPVLFLSSEIEEARESLDELTNTFFLSKPYPIDSLLKIVIIIKHYFSDNKLTKDEADLFSECA